jgi:SAM-dependent methyltransferase
MEQDNQHNPKLRLLVVFACFGEKNIDLLKRIIAHYRSMTLDVDVVVVSDAPKDLGEGVEVIVGLPTEDPWSLPFAHNAVLAQRVEQYDLFAYSEDDMDVTEENIRSFLRVAPQLAPDEIAGFLRYEADASGNRSFPDIYDAYRWKPESVKRRGSLVVAEFTNEHAAYFLLTRDQLRKAIASGGFVRAPYRGRHDMACTAATDPYTSCGFHKVICISELENFLIHHASNRYLALGRITLPALKEQTQALINICDGTRPAKTLCEVEPKVHQHWSKSLYEEPARVWLDAVPEKARTILSIGCGWGAFEEELQRRGAVVTALPLDSVIGTAAERRGVQVVYGTLDEGLQMVRTRKFDCVVMSYLVHLLPDPTSIINACSLMIQPGGKLLLSAPNFNRFPVLLKRTFLNGDYRKLRNFGDSGITVCDPSGVARMAGNAGFRVTGVHWLNHTALSGKGRPPALKLGGLTAQDWMLELQHN